MAEELKHTEPLVPSHLERAVGALLGKQSPRVSLSPWRESLLNISHSNSGKKRSTGAPHLELGSLKPPVSELCWVLLKRTAGGVTEGLSCSSLQVQCVWAFLLSHCPCWVPSAAACFNYSQTFVPPSGCAHNSAKRRGAVWAAISFCVKVCKDRQEGSTAGKKSVFQNES